MSVDEMYSELILDYYKNPKNFGSLDNPDIMFKDTNPICGDVVQIELKIDSQNIVDACFNGSGCAISQVTSDLLISNVKGKSLDEIKLVSKDDVLDLLGIELSPVRLKCALLCLKVLKSGVYSYFGEKISEVDDDN